MKVPFPKGVLYPFALACLNLVKMQIPQVGARVFPHSFEFCFATIGVCVFRCADFGWRTFYYISAFQKGETNVKKLYSLIALFLLLSSCFCFICSCESNEERALRQAKEAAEAAEKAADKAQDDYKDLLDFFN